MNIEQIMQEEGWLKTEYENDGFVYVEFHKNGLVVDLDSIIEEENTNE